MQQVKSRLLETGVDWCGALVAGLQLIRDTANYRQQHRPQRPGQYLQHLPLESQVHE